MDQPILRPHSRSVATLAAALATLLAGEGQAAEAPAWRVVQADVRVVCPLTVGGSFEARTTSLVGTLALAGSHPVAFAGDLAVDLRTLDTDIGLRNEHLRNTYLEVGKGEGFERAVLSDIRLGDVDPATFQGKSHFTGRFLLHGATKTVEGQAEIRREGRTIHLEASFPVAVFDYGIPKPQYLGVGVTNEVKVKVSLVVEPVVPEATR